MEICGKLYPKKRKNLFTFPNVYVKMYAVKIGTFTVFDENKPIFRILTADLFIFFNSYMEVFSNGTKGSVCGDCAA
jgi:hypothetical protein